MESVLDILQMLWPLLILQLVLMVAALVDWARRRQFRYLPKMAWLLMIVLVNTIGPIIYFVVGRGDE